MNFLKNGFLPVLSPQQITSCDTIDGVEGCNGGDPYSAYQYVEKKGIETNKAYPYKSGNTQSTGQCKYSKKKVDADVQITGYTVVSSSAAGEKKMATQIQAQPLPYAHPNPNPNPHPNLNPDPTSNAPEHSLLKNGYLIVPKTRTIVTSCLHLHFLLGPLYRMIVLLLTPILDLRAG